MKKRIFMTGASGCIGHYIAESLIQETDHDLYLLVRDPSKLKFDWQARDGIKIIPGDLQNIEDFKELLGEEINVAILAATAWGGREISYEINVNKTISLINLLNPELCEQVIYFSTASILDRNNQPLPEAEKFGTDYISTKYACYQKLKKQPLSPKITTVFPTLVFGGEKNKPYSHISGGLPEVFNWINLIRWLKADGSFHFIHAKDIATIITYLVNHPPEIPQDLVLGNEKITVEEGVKQIAAALGKKVYWQIPLSITLANILIKLFKIQMDDWSRFSLDYRHFTYQNVVNPATFNLTNYCPTIKDIIEEYNC